MAKRGLLANIFHRSDPNDRDQLKIREEKVKAKVLHAIKFITLIPIWVYAYMGHKLWVVTYLNK